MNNALQSEQLGKRSLGQTGIMVTPVGLGVMQFAGGKGLFGRAFPALPQAEKNAITQAALEGGINWFDTAELYGFGRSEESLALALQEAGKSDDEIVVATKWFPMFRTARNISRTIERRIRYLAPYAIDLYMVHQPIGFSSPEAEMSAMADLVEAGKIRAIGVSNFNAERMQRAYEALQKRGIPLAVNQVHYSLIHRDIEWNGVLATARELGVTIVAYTPLGYGLLTGKLHKNPELLAQKTSFRRRGLTNQLESSRPLVTALEEIGQNYSATAGQVALNWLVNFTGETVVAIPGASKVVHARESAGALNFRMSSNEMGRIDALSRELNPL